MVLILGMCPTLGVTTSAINGLGMGLATTFVILLSNVIISAIKNFIPDNVHIPAYIVVIASLVTGADNMWVDAATKAYADANGLAKDGDYTKLLPKYPNQIIWPYTDMVQHRLFMENDIRTGWCRTTPLWGRGLSRRLTGADDRLHDCRARSVLEAIMWHGYSRQSDAFRATEKFYHLEKADRQAVIKFIESI